MNTIPPVAMLNGGLKLHDVDNVEGFTAAILAGARLDLTSQDRHDLHAYLIELCWELSLKYRPGGITFSTWARTTLQYRVVDWNRQWNGRTRWAFADHVFEREARTAAEFDDDAVGSSSMDPAERGDPDGPRVEPGGNLGSVAYLPPRSLGSPRGAPGALHHGTLDPRPEKAAA